MAKHVATRTRAGNERAKVGQIWEYRLADGTRRRALVVGVKSGPNVLKPYRLLNLTIGVLVPPWWKRFADVEGPWVSTAGPGAVGWFRVR